MGGKGLAERAKSPHSSSAPDKEDQQPPPHGARAAPEPTGGGRVGLMKNQMNKGSINCQEASQRRVGEFRSHSHPLQISLGAPDGSKILSRYSDNR